MFGFCNLDNIVNAKNFHILREEAGLTDVETELFLSLLTIRYLKRKEHYILEGDVCSASAYVNKGCFRRYIIDNHSKEIIINFAFEDHWIGDLEGLFLKTHQLLQSSAGKQRTANPFTGEIL